jgi:hypothetical protein
MIEWTRFKTWHVANIRRWCETWPNAMFASGQIDWRVQSARQQQGQVPNGYFMLGTPIYTCWPALGEVSWTFWHPNILLSWAYSLLLISLAWLTNQREIEWSQVHLIVSLHLVGTWVIFSYGILVSLGGCCHLDGLEAVEVLWQEWCLFLATSRWFVRGVVPSPAKRQRQL